MAAAGFGLFYGALFLGGAISLLHLIHNRIDSPRNALVLWVFFSLGTGSVCAVLCGISTTARLLLARWRDGSREARQGDAALFRDLVAGLALFHLAFFLPVALYGLTYDQVPFGAPETAAGMLLFLVLAGLAVAAGCLLLAWIATRLLAPGLVPGRSRLPLYGFAGLLVVHIVACSAFALAKDPAGDASPTAAARPMQLEQRSAGRVVLVGFDGADWRVLRPLLERGRLPAFERLVKEGSWGELATLADANSAVIWASIYTGKTPAQHRVLDFYRIRLAGMAAPGIFPVHRTFFIQATEALEPLGLAHRRIVDRSFLAARPIWEILDDLGLRIGIVDGYYFSVPAYPLATEGGYFFSYALNTLSGRPDWSLREADPQAIGALVQPPAMLPRYLRHASRDDFYWQSATLLDLLASHPQPDFVHLYTHQPDARQHGYWRWLEPRRYLGVDPAARARHGEEIPDLYRDFDRFLGDLMEALDPRTTLIIASDHGHSPTLFHAYDTQHRHGPPGILLLWGAGVRRGQELSSAHVYDLAPTVLHLLGLPIGEDMPGRVLYEALTPSLQDPAGRIASYEPFGRDDTPAASGADLTAEELERLRALGYL